MFENAKFFTSRLAIVSMVWAALLAVTGCQTSQPHFADVATSADGTNTISPESIVLSEGDVVKVTFPSAPNLNTSGVAILRDGTISLPLVGQVHAAGKTAAQLQQDLIKLYANQVESKQIRVEVLASNFPIFVTGAVLKPGKVTSNHPMTALEAIMEAGGFDYTKANLKSVSVLRREDSHLHSYKLDMKKVMAGQDQDPFYMKPGDIIYVKEKFAWF